MLLYETSTPVQAHVVSVAVGNAFGDFLRAGFGQLQRRVLVISDVMLIFVKCTVEYFPRIQLQNSSLELAAVSLISVGCITLVCVGALCEAELSHDFTTRAKLWGGSLDTCLLEGELVSADTRPISHAVGTL